MKKDEDVEVTATMAAAGVAVLDQMDGPLLREALVSEVYRAMTRARAVEQSCSTSLNSSEQA